MTEPCQTRSWSVTAWKIFFGTGRVVRGRILIALAFGLLLAIFGIFAYRARTQYALDERWKSELEALGARAMMAGYSNASWVGPVPILGEFVSYRRQMELFLDNPTTIDAVLDKATTLPQLRKFWVDLTVFDRSMEARIHEKLPEMPITFYTPGNAAGNPSPATTDSSAEE